MATSKYRLLVSDMDSTIAEGETIVDMADSGINIANFHLGRLAQGGDAIAFLEIDSAVSEEDLQILQSLPQIDRCRFLEFPEMSE